MNRRALLLSGAMSPLAIALGACGFRPLLASAEGDSVRNQLASVRITGLGGRLGQHLKIALEENLDPTSSGKPELYDLRVRLRTTNRALAIQLDNTTTRNNLTISANFQLQRKEDKKVLYASSIQRVASFNVRRAPFATLTARNDAERRAAREIADDIRTLLALHFERRTDDA